MTWKRTHPNRWRTIASCPTQRHRSRLDRGDDEPAAADDLDPAHRVRDRSSAVLLLIGLTVLTIYYSTKATVMRVAVGPEGSDDVKFVEVLQANSTPTRVDSVAAGVQHGPVTRAGHPRRRPPDFDLAVVRGNMKLSTDWPVVAILRKDVVALIVPAPRAPAKRRRAPKARWRAKPPKIERRRRPRRQARRHRRAAPTAARNCSTSFSITTAFRQTR